MTKQEEKWKNFYPETSTFHWENKNLKHKISRDCVIRAIASATDKSWEEVFKDLAELSLSTGYMPNEEKNFSKYLKKLGFVQRKTVKDFAGTKMSGSEFCKELSDNRYGTKNTCVIVAKIGCRHLTCIKPDSEGITKVHDTWDCSNNCVGKWWVLYKDNEPIPFSNQI